MKTILIYDLEIVKCILSKSSERNPDYEYCDGWRDFENMGISIIGFAINDNPPEAIDFSEEFVDPDSDSENLAQLLFDSNNELTNLERFLLETAKADVIVGFNSKDFDDRLAAANYLGIQTNYDLLEEIRKAAYGSSDWKDQPPGFSYSLDEVARANGMAKTGSGALAPQLWQQGRKQDVIDYCLHDVDLTRDILHLGLEGNLKDPNNGDWLKLAPLPL